MTKVAIYARYSSDLQSDASVADQIRLCEEFIKSKGWDVYNCYTDHGHSRASLTLRPGVQQLLQDGLAGKYQVLVAEALDRLSRDQEDITGIYKRMQFAGLRNKGTCNNRLTIDQKVLEASLLQALHGQLMNPELCDVFCQDATRYLNDLRKRHNAALAGYQAELAKLSKARDRIVKAVVEGFSTDEMKVELDRIVARRKELETLLDGEEAKPVILHPNMAVH